jgi:hypothetical protein
VANDFSTGFVIQNHDNSANQHVHPISIPSVAATATLTVDGADVATLVSQFTGGGAAATFKLVDTDGTTHTFTFNPTHNNTVSNIIGYLGAASATDNATQRNLLVIQISATINAGTCSTTITAASTADGTAPTVTFTQDVAGAAGNTTSTDNSNGIVLGNFTGGVTAFLGGNNGRPHNVPFLLQDNYAARTTVRTGKIPYKAKIG